MDNIFNLSNPEAFNRAFGYFSHLKEKGATIEINEKKLTRSSQQNRALHLFFNWAANALNDHHDYFIYRGLKGNEVEMEWSGEMFKEFYIKPIIKVLYDIKSTTKLKTNEIDQVIDIVTKHFSDKGISIYFPSSFGYWLEQTGY